MGMEKNIHQVRKKNTNPGQRPGPNTSIILKSVEVWLVLFFCSPGLTLESGSSRVFVKLYEVELYLSHTFLNQGLILVEGKDLEVDFDKR